MTCKKLSATSQTASTLSIEDIKAGNIAATASTSAEIKLSGKTQNAALQASLSSTIKGKDLVAEIATLNASTSATATVTATKQVSLKQARSGKAVYYGNPSKIINNTK
ncbi:GIN domain-containing protein [uncultured Muribaculum sp.]|uniref:GIN domain-containing protein n=1 Tax=uncultured Muribaculum sp. TaxID=1918613 RepID=UPI00351A21E1